MDVNTEIPQTMSQQVKTVLSELGQSTAYKDHIYTEFNKLR